MTIIERRLCKLEDQFGSATGKLRRCILLVVCEAGSGDHDPYIQILSECGFLPTGPIGVVNFCAMPTGMNTEEAERFLRENGAEICSR